MTNSVYAAISVLVSGPCLVWVLYFGLQPGFGFGFGPFVDVLWTRYSFYGLYLIMGSFFWGFLEKEEDPLLEVSSKGCSVVSVAEPKIASESFS